MPVSRSKKPKKTSFVPRGLFNSIAAVGVIPLCACGGRTVTPPTQVLTGSVAEMAFDGGVQGVGLQAFDGSARDGNVFVVARQAFDAVAADAFVGVAADAFAFDSVADTSFRSDSVAADAFAGVAQMMFDTGAPDVIFTVATDAFAGVADAGFKPDATIDAGADAPFTVGAPAFDGSVPPDGGK